MERFNDKQSLTEAYQIRCELDGMEPVIAKMIAKDKPRYSPHLYRGGWVIPGFGYSVERINRYVAAERAGNPCLV